MATDLTSYTDGPFEYTLPPNPQFQFGQAVDSTPQGKKWVEGEKEGWKVIDTATEDPLSVKSSSLHSTADIATENLCVSEALHVASGSNFWAAVPSHDQRNCPPSCGVRIFHR